MADNLMEWFKTHRAALGAGFLGLATIIGGAGQIYDADQLVHAAGLCALIGTTLAGAGMARSDEYHRDKLALVKTKIDRRNPDSLIPVKDLQKLVAKDPKAGRTE